MKFCVISPVAGFQRFATMSDTHLLLPQLHNIPGYKEFYKKRREIGDFLILDNGAYEGQSDWNNLLHCIRFYKPQVAVLPDYLLQDWGKTYREAMYFLDRFQDEFPDTAWMYVPQSTEGNVLGFVDGMYKALEDPRISWIALPRALPLKICKDKFIRARMAETLKKRVNIKIHALGMVKGSVEELDSLRSCGAVDSVDSNAPVWRGWKGWFITEQGWPEIPCDYSAGLPELASISKIYYNLNRCGFKVEGIHDSQYVARAGN